MLQWANPVEIHTFFHLLIDDNKLSAADLMIDKMLQCVQEASGTFLPNEWRTTNIKSYFPYYSLLVHN